MRGTVRTVSELLYRIPAPPILRALAAMVYRVFRNFSRDDGSHMAAGLAYYAIFSLFPLILGTIAIAGFFLDAPAVQTRVIELLEDQLPGLGDTELIRGNIESLVQARGAFTVVAVVGLFWSSRAVFGAIHRVLNRAWKVHEPRHFLLYQMLQVGGAASIAALFLASAAVGTVGRAVLSQTDLLLNVRIPWDALFTILPLVVSTSLFLFIYRYVPDARVRWGDALPAALLASTLFESAKAAFAFYLINLSSLDLVYGSVTTVVVLMLFLYVVSMVLVLGAELASEVHQSTTKGLLQFRGHWRPVRGGLGPTQMRVTPRGASRSPESPASGSSAT